MKHTVHIGGVAAKSLPSNLYKEIGRVTVTWAYFETLLQRTIYDLIGVTPDIGRLVVVEKRGQEQIDLIYDLCTVAQLTPNPKDKEPIKKRIAEAKSTRDHICHGIWFKDQTGYHVQSTRGQWNKNDVHELHKISRKIIPKGLKYDTQKLRACHEEILRLVSDVGNLRDNLRKQLQALQTAHQPPSTAP